MIVLQQKNSKLGVNGEINKKVLTPTLRNSLWYTYTEGGNADDDSK